MYGVLNRSADKPDDQEQCASQVTVQQWIKIYSIPVITTNSANLQRYNIKPIITF